MCVEPFLTKNQGLVSLEPHEKLRYVEKFRALKTVCTVWVAATSDEVHLTQGLLEAQGDSQRLRN